MKPLTSSQSAAADRILSAVRNGQPVVSLSGPAGSGKTTMISALQAELDDSVVCTPTNKAAQVLCQKGIDATTFYKRFFIVGEGRKGRGGNLSFVSCREYLDRIAAVAGGDWTDHLHKLPEGKLAHVETLVVDEGSMITSHMVRRMQDMCDTMLLVGDGHQLPPVGDTQNPRGFFCTRSHDAELTEVLRQGEGSMILQLATEIRRNSPKVAKGLQWFYPEDRFDAWVARGARSICFTNKERIRINFVTRRILGIGSDTPVPGDVMLVTNNYSEDLLNGTEVTLVAFEWGGGRLAQATVRDLNGKELSASVDMAAFIKDQIASAQKRLTERATFDPHCADPLEDPALELTFGHCLTAHKAQGSEWDAVVVFDQRGLIRKIAAETAALDRRAMDPDEAVRRWLYTSITRARKDLTVAPTWWAALNQQSTEAA